MHRVNDCLARIDVRKGSISSVLISLKDEPTKEVLQFEESDTEVDARTAVLYIGQGNTDNTELMVIDDTLRNMQ